MGNQSSSRRQAYNAYYDALERGGDAIQRFENKWDWDKISFEDVDPHIILGVGPDYTWEELQHAFRQLAKSVHPDKGGSARVFNLVTQCFKHLAKDLKTRHVDRPHHELKREYNNYAREQPQQQQAPLPESEPFIDKFNRLFATNRLRDEESEFGYGDMMDESTGLQREDIEIQRKLKKFEASAFNKLFDKEVGVSQEVVAYKDPEPMVLAKRLNYTEIGGERPSDYSRDTASTAKKGNLLFTDYKRAYTATRLVDASRVDLPDYKNVQQYEEARDKKMAIPRTPEEIAEQAREQKAAKKAEKSRQQRIKEQDNAAAAHFDRMTRMMLGS